MTNNRNINAKISTVVEMRLELKRLANQVKVLDAKNNTLKREVAYLNAELYAVQGVKTITKKLARAIDRSIENRISSLDKKRPKQRSKPVNFIKGSNDPIALSRILRQNDTNSFYSVRIFRYKKSLLRHRILLQGYRINRNIARSAIKKAHSIKKLNSNKGS